MKKKRFKVALNTSEMSHDKFAMSTFVKLLIVLEQVQLKSLD